MAFNAERFAKRVREKRGTRPLREVAEELQLGTATLFRVESGKMPDLHNFDLICQWLGDNHAGFFDVDAKSDDAISIQLRAAQRMSVETSSALMEIIRAAYTQALAQTNDDNRV